MKGVKTLRFFYNGRCIRFMSECKTMASKSKGLLIAKYKFDCSKADLFPEFNEGFEYVYIDEQIDKRDVMSVNRETVTIMAYDAKPDEYGVLTTEYEVETPVLINAGDIVTRSIYSDSLPIKISFGQNTTVAQPRELSLLGVDYLNITNATKNIYSLFGRCQNLQYVNNVNDWVISGISNLGSVFYDCRSLTQLDLSNWDTSNVTAMNGMFQNCMGLTQLDVSNFDTSNVTTMYCMFANCQKLTEIVGIENFITTNVQNMEGMFASCQSLTSIDVSNFDTSNVTNMGYMFYNCNKLASLDVSNFNTSKVTNMQYMFRYCDNLISITMNNSYYNSVNKIIEQLPTRTTDSMGTLNIAGVDDINQVDTSTAESKFWNIDNQYKVAEYKFNSSIDTLFSEVNEGFVYTHTDIDNGDGTITRTIRSDQLPTIVRFEDCEGLLELLYLNTSELTTLRKSFKNCYNVTSINATDWDISKVTSLYEAFEDCNNLTTLDVSNWDTSNVTDMFGIFDNCHSLITLDVSNWDTFNVVDMNGVFCDCYSLTSLDVSNWNTSNVTDMDAMFNDCRSLTSLDLSNFDTSKVTDMYQMFCDCYLLTQLDLSNFDTSNVTDMDGMFNDCQSLTSLDLSNFDTSNVTDMSEMFYACKSLTTLDLSNFDTSKVTDMQYMFGFYETGDETMALTSIIGLENFDTSKVTSMIGMFCNCRNLTTLDISNWDVSNVTDMSGMFYNCYKLTSLDISNWDTSNVTATANMFDNCTNLISITMNNSDYNSVNKIIEQLPTRTTDSIGYLYIEGVDDHKLVNKSEAELKYWAIMTIFPNIKYYTLANEAEGAFTYPIINSDESVLSNSSIYIKPIENEGSDETVLCIEIETQDDINSIQFVNPEFLLKMLILDTSNMTTMRDLFKNCTQLNSIECSDWDTSNVTDMQGMFYDCNKLTSIDLSNFNTSNVTNMESMFTNCSNLSYINMNNSDYNSVNKIIAQLPTRTADSMGTLNIAGVDDISQVDTTTAESKFWNII